MRYAKTLAVVALALGATVLGAGSASAAGPDDVTWTVRTASNDFGGNRTSYRYDIKPGATIKDNLVVANRGKDALTLGVYAADGFTTEAGQLDLVTKGAKSTAVGAWVHAGKDSVTIPAGKTVKVPFTVTIPENATPGDHAGGIVTSLVQPDATETINVDRRLGIAIKLRVDGDLKPGFAIDGLKADYRGTLNPAGKGDADVTYTIRNTGNAILSGSASTSIIGPFSKFKVDGAEQSTPTQLLPGETWKVSERISGVAPAGRLTTTTKLVPVIIDAAGSSTALPPVTATATSWALPWTLILLVLLLLVGIIGLVRISRRNRARRKAREDARVEEAVNKALQNS
jgi:hypothetical protein